MHVLLSPDLLAGTEAFKKGASDLVKKVKAGRTKDGQHVHIPGYDSEAKRQEILASGEIEIKEKLIEDLKNKIGTVV